MKEQPRGVSLILAFLFLAGAGCVFWIAAQAGKSGVVEMIDGRSGPTTVYRSRSPEVFWMCVMIYVLAGLGCTGGFVYQVRNVARKLKISGQVSAATKFNQT